MTEETAPEPAEPIEPTAQAVPERARIESPPRRRGMDVLPVLYLVGFLVLAGALAYLYVNPLGGAQAPAQANQVGSLEEQVAGLSGRIGQLESRPAPATDLTAVQTQLATLDRRMADLANRPAPAAADQASQARLDDLEKRLSTLSAAAAAAPAGLAALAAQVQALQSRPVPQPADLGPLTGRMQAVETQQGQLAQQLGGVQQSVQQIGQRLDALANDLHTAGTQTSGQLDALSKQVDAVKAEADKTAGALASTTQRAERIARVAAAGEALATGQKLGALQGAPPALARFADQAPPTDAELRLAFPKYAEAAQHASQPAIMDNQDVGTRLWTRAQQLVNVRQGDRVLIGDPVAGVLAQAREAINNGDLKGAVQALHGLAGPALAAMQPWLDQAQSLLDARAALATMAAG